MDGTSNMQSSNAPLTPTFIGHIASTLDALMLFEACLSSSAFHVARRPHDRERQELIKSGHVFIYEEHSSGIKRWTDGVAWSPSRILGNFLIYRELDRPFPPGEKKRATKRTKKSTGVSKSESGPRQGSGGVSGPGMGTPPGLDTPGGGKETERSLIGSLVDSYPFKEGGLVKKTISVTYNGVPHHLVSYYSVKDVVEGKLMTPTKAPSLAGIIPRSELIMSQNFRAPIDEVEYNPDERGQGLFTPVQGHPGMPVHGGMIHRTMSLPNVQAVHLGQYPTTSPFSLQPQLPQYIGAVSAGTGNSGYMPQTIHHYPYEAHRQSRYGSTAGLGADMTRALPLSPPRRHSTTYEAAAADLNLATLPAIPESRSMGNNTYMAPSYYHTQRPSDNAPQDAGFPSPRDVHAESVGLAGDRGPHGLGFDEMGRDAGSWGAFDGLEANQNQYMPGSNGQWPPATSNLGRA